MDLKLKELFQKQIHQAERIVALTGAGVSAESGIPTFRGKGGLWRQYSAIELASVEAWEKDPVLVWQFYNWRREIVAKAKPNPAHLALAQWEKKLCEQGKHFTLITQNVDELHFEAGSQQVIPLHGSLWKVRCTQCNTVEENRDVPITPGFAHQPTFSDLPRCSHCEGILRPHVVWFGESLSREIVKQASEAVSQAELFLLIGTSAVVFPAAGFVYQAKQQGIPLWEINLEPSGVSSVCDHKIYGKAGEILPGLLL